MSERKCPSCGASIDLNATECKYCGEAIIVQVPQYQVQQAPQYQVPQTPQAPQYQVPQTPQAPQYQVPQTPPVYTSYSAPVKTKSKTTAGILAILLGGIGVHKFYLGKIGQGILYLLFCWTYIPAIIALIEGIIYLTSSEEKFYMKYVRK